MSTTYDAMKCSMFTVLSHPLHVLYIKHNRMSSYNNYRFISILKSSYNILCNERKINLLKSIHIRTFQGFMSYNVLFKVNTMLDNKDNKNIKHSMIAGCLENIFSRQILLTAGISVINNVNIYDKNIWKDMIVKLPITTVFRSLYFGFAISGKNIGNNISSKYELSEVNNNIISGLLGISMGIPWISSSEIFTDNSLRGYNMKKNIIDTYKKSINCYKNPLILGRESLFLIPIIFFEKI